MELYHIVFVSYFYQHYSLTPSAFCRRHPTSKINSPKRHAKPYTWHAIMYRWNKSMDVQKPTQRRKNWSHSLLNTFSVLVSLLTIVNHSWYTWNFVFKVRNLGFILDSACFAPHSEATHNQNVSNSLLWTKTHQLHPQVPYRRRSKTTGNFLCIVQIRLLQFSPYGYSELCNSTDAEYCCTHINVYSKAQRCLSFSSSPYP